MPLLIASGNPLGLRALGSGGLAATDAYDQIVSALRQRLGPEHGALFAEPSRQATNINWYATVDSPLPPVRLIEAPADRRSEGLRRLGGLVADIEALIGRLAKSDAQGERVLAGILGHAIEIPTESHVYLVGMQPVMAFWGHATDEDQPATGVLRNMVQRAANQPNAELPDTATPASAGVRENTGVTMQGARILTAAEVPTKLRWRSAIPTAWLWLVFALFLLTCGVELLRGCAIGLPYALTGWLLNYCPAPQGPAQTLAAERAQQEALGAEYDDLVREAAVRRQECQIPSGTNRGLPPMPVETPKPGPNLKLPEKQEAGLGFLLGCWQAQKGLREVSNGRETGHSVDVTYCFDKSGKGKRIIVVDDGARCVGELAAIWTENKLKIHGEPIDCASKGHGRWVPAEVTCTGAPDGEALCTQPDPDDPTHPSFVDHPFSHIPGDPSGASAGQP